MGMYDKYAQQCEQFQKQSYFHLASPVRDKDVKPVQSTQASPGRYGIVALYNDIRFANPTGTSHALGLDLTVLGLALTSPEPLHKHFASPWADEPVKGDPEFTVPECYYDKQPPPLKVSLLTYICSAATGILLYRVLLIPKFYLVQACDFSKFSLETLFYVFYR